MLNSTNSFAQSVIDLTNNVNIALNSMVELNNSLTTENDSVVVEVAGNDPITGDASIYTYSIPSYHYILNQLNRISNTVDVFVSGQGVVLLNDGTYREVTTVPVAKSPAPITAIPAPTKFNARSNWFFESMMEPQLYVEFELKGKIDDRSDRVVVRRVIFDNYNDEQTQWFKDTFIGKQFTYEEVVNIMNVNGKRYWLDEQVEELPLKPTEYTGKFLIVNKGVINNAEWFYLDTVNFGLTTDFTVVNNVELKIGDQLRYGDSIYKIESIEITEKRVKLIALVGMGKPTINDYFYIYSTPFEEKLVQVPVGYNECDIIFFKGVNDDFNVIADSWGTSVNFYTNDLTLVDSTTDFATYYFNTVSDFGKQLEGQAKEKFIPAFYGVKPDAPTFTASDFAVKQINTQMNAALDTEAIKNTQTQIESTKTIINSLKTTIAQQKAQLVELTDVAQRADLNSKITANINDLSKKTVEYQSLVRSLATIAYENSAVMADPKYRIRGFFSIPDPKGTPPQQVIQFEIAYRYLKLDNTGISLNTFEHADPSTGQIVRGTFTDWTIVSSPIKKKVLDASTGTYSWEEEDIADGEQVNINQVDIPITKGEKVEIKIRSISEAGWPLNPLKSDWSSTVIMEFPSNLEGSDQVVNILEDAAADEQAIKLDETLNSAGVYTHLNDSIPNPLAGSGTYFKHQAVNISYDLPVKDSAGIVSEVKTTDLQSQLSSLAPNTYITITKPTGLPLSEPDQLTKTLQQWIQALVNLDPSVYEALS
ncbi:MAG: hypothetical protein GYA51_00070 [Candidatus Methanofastidiosa archaeon]|jgi:hypothetical protein|nr:hypothetical protein [Candidatus Methanofastidiosa archaeon]